MEDKEKKTKEANEKDKLYFNDKALKAFKKREEKEKELKKDTFSYKASSFFSRILEKIKQFPKKVIDVIKNLPSMIIFGDKKGFGYDMAKKEAEQDKRVNSIREKAGYKNEEKENEKQETKEKESPKQEINKARDLIPTLSNFMKEKIDNKEFITNEELTKIGAMIDNDMSNGLKDLIEKVEKKSNDLSDIEKNLQRVVKLAQSKTLQEMTAHEKIDVTHLSTLANRHQELRVEAAKAINELSHKIEDYNFIADKLNNFDSEKLPIECTGKYANQEVRRFSFDCAKITEEDILINKDTLSEFKDFICEMGFEPGVQEYLESMNLVKNIDFREIMDEGFSEELPIQENTTTSPDEIIADDNKETIVQEEQPIKPDIELESFVSESSEIINEVENDINERINEDEESYIVEDYEEPVYDEITMDDDFEL